MKVTFKFHNGPVHQRGGCVGGSVFYGDGKLTDLTVTTITKSFTGWSAAALPPAQVNGRGSLVLIDRTRRKVSVGVVGRFWLSGPEGAYSLQGVSFSAATGGGLLDGRRLPCSAKRPPTRFRWGVGYTYPRQTQRGTISVATFRNTGTITLTFNAATN
jgi:hypothetical protein